MRRAILPPAERGPWQSLWATLPFLARQVPRSPRNLLFLFTLFLPAAAAAEEPKRPIAQGADGVVTLAARDAVTHGERLRYEPEPHKNTLGYWTRPEDWCQWRFALVRPGRYELWVLQGCGKGQGGSEVAATVGGQTIAFTVEETGHFQNFKHRNLGPVTLDKPGEYTLELRPRTKAAAAVMDVRQVRLIPLDP